MRRTTHHAAGIEVDHDSQIGKALHGANVGDVCYPSPVWRSHVELPGQRVADRQGWLAAVAARSALVACLRLDTRQSGQPGDTVRAGCLSLIEQIIVQLALAIDLAAIVPGLPQ